MIIDSSNFHSQLLDVVEAEESDVRLEKQVDDSIAVTDYISNQVLIEVREDTGDSDIVSDMEEAVELLESIQEQLTEMKDKPTEERVESKEWLSDARQEVYSGKYELREIKNHLEEVMER